MARSSSKSAARSIDAEYQAIKRDRGPIPETFTHPGSGEVKENCVMISVRALNRLSAALRGEDTLRAMARRVQREGSL